MTRGRDFFTSLKVPAANLNAVQVTGDKADAPVIDLRDEDPNATVGFLILPTAVATADATNFLDLEIWEADEKTSTTALTAGAKAADDDVLGPAKDGALLDDAAPMLNQVRINATGLAGSVYFLQYRGYKPCVQLQVAETGTADATFVVIPVIVAGRMQNMKAPVVS